MAEDKPTNDWFWDVDRQIAVRSDNTSKHDVLIGPYPSRRDAEIWMPSASWSGRAASSSDDDWIDINSAYD